MPLQQGKASTVEATEQETDIDSLVDGLLEPEQAEGEEDTGEQDVSEDDAAEAEDEAEEAGDDDGDEPEVEADDEDEGESEGDEQPQRFTVKVDGEEREVTLDDLKRGYAGQAYIQKGMQEAATVKKEAEQFQQTLQQEREQLAQFYQTLQQQGAMPQPTPPSEDLANTDPVAYMQQRARYDREVSEWQAQQAQAQQLQQRQTEEQKQQHQAYLAKQQSALIEAIPEFGDPQKAADLKGKLTQFAVDSGVPAEAVAQISDAATVKLLHDAYRYREAQKSVGQKTAKAQKTVKPGRKTTDGDRAKRAQDQKLKRLRQSGSMDAAADFILNSK